MEWYCPACGTYTDKNRALKDDDELLISPGDQPFTCPECGTVFNVHIEFVETGEISPTERTPE